MSKIPFKASVGAGVVACVGLAWAQASCGDGASPTDASGGSAIAKECSAFCSLQASCVADAAGRAAAEASVDDCTQECTSDVGDVSSACQAQFTTVDSCFTASGCAAFTADPNTGACYQAFASWASACDPAAIPTGADPNASTASGSAVASNVASKAALHVVLGRWLKRPLRAW